MRLPDIRRQLHGAGKQQVRVFQHLIVGVVLGGDAKGVCLDAQVDVLGNKNDMRIGVLAAEIEGDAEQGVVRCGGAQAVRQVGVRSFHVKIQPSGLEALGV